MMILEKLEVETFGLSELDGLEIWTAQLK